MKTLTVLLIFASTLLSGCDEMTELLLSGDLSGTRNKHSKSFYTEIGILPQLISMPRQPVAAKWEIERYYQDDSLVALLKFTESDYKYVIENSMPYETIAEGKVSAEVYDQWLPDDAKSGITVKPFQSMGVSAYELIGINRQQANLFTDPKRSSFCDGFIIPLKNGYILAFLYTS